jgi:diguanylate cyclase (GGDEF)-like protein/PAS domain S-box-containing protein
MPPPSIKVLYAEDNPQDADLVRRALTRLAPQVRLEVATTIQSAIDRLAQAPAFDMVLTDLRLTDGSGLDLLAHIRGQQLPLAVVVLTGSGDQDSAIAALKSGADDYLTKRGDYLTRLPQTLTRALSRFQDTRTRKVVNLRVLYAEHNVFDVDLTRRHLKQHTPHIQLDVVGDSQAVITRLQPMAVGELPYDVLLLDYRLPGNDALELVKVLREERGLQLPIVLITGQGSEEIAAQALSLGVDDYLSKHSGYLFELPATLEKAYRQTLLEREQVALYDSKTRYDELVARIPAGVYRFRMLRDGSQCFDYVSPRFCQMLDVDSRAVVADSSVAFARVHPEDLAGLVQAIDEARHTRLAFNWTGRFVTRGETRWVILESTPTVLDNGDVVWDGVLVDITERKQSELMQQVRNEVLDRIIARQPLPTILEAMVHQLEAIHPEMLVSVLLFDATTGRLSVGAAPSLPDFYNAAVEGLPAGLTNGSCGAAVYLGETVIVQDIATHPYWQPYREITARANLGACWSHPFKDDTGQVLGTFGIYYDRPRTPQPADLSLIAEFSRIAGLAVLHARSDAIRLESEQRFRATFDQSTLLMGIVAPDGALMSVNPSALAVIDALTVDVVGKPFKDTPWWRGNPDQQHRLQQALDRALKGNTDHFEASHPVATGGLMDVEFNATPIQIGNTTQVLVTGIDITQRKRTDEVLRQSAKVFDSTHDGIMIAELDGRIISVNPAFTQITGYSQDEVVGQNPRMLQSGRHDRSFYQTMWATVRETGRWQGEVWNRRKNGEIFPEWLTLSTVLDTCGVPTNYVAVFSDISQIKQSEARLEHLAHYDALTQLPNRLLLFSRMEHSLAIAQRDSKKLAFLMLDLDHFKDINDSLGHLAGDELLQQVAQRLTARLRNVDTICRLGGDEFTVLMEEIAHPEDAARVASEIIASLSEPWKLSNGAEVRIGVSVGISLFPDHGNTAEALLRQADTSMYQAKAQGRGRFRFFSEELTRNVRARIDLEARLRRAIDQNELRVFYQPQVDIESGHVVGAEALVRWLDPVHGLIMPGEFIPLAEETGLITAIGNWVLLETCRQGRCWLDAGLPALTLAVNLSPHQFLHSNVQEVVSAALLETGFPAANLELELTESALMTRQDEAINTLRYLRGLGVRLAMDDFGTGYSSLAYLKRFKLDVLKIDKSFIDDLPHDADDKAITISIIAIAHALQMKVLAEGVETAEQLDLLRQQGCNLYQGYLCSRPVPPEAFVKLLSV